MLTQNEIDAANSVRLEELNSQGQPVYEWPYTFALARAYLDQLERHGGMSTQRANQVRAEIAEAEGQSGGFRTDTLRKLADSLGMDARMSADPDRVRMLVDALNGLAG